MVPLFTGRIVEWDPARGHGWLETGEQRIFLHHRDFAEIRRRLAVGDRIRFTAGTGPNGRTCARNAVHLDDGGHLGFGSAVVLAALLILPALAFATAPIDRRIVACHALLASLIAYWAYASDKRRARTKAWRVSEATLHFLEMIGGWPGAFIAQRRLRHKCSKGTYQAVFWLIVLAYQFAAFEMLTGWRLASAAVRTLRTVIQ